MWLDNCSGLISFRRKSRRRRKTKKILRWKFLRQRRMCCNLSLMHTRCKLVPSISTAAAAARELWLSFPRLLLPLSCSCSTRSILPPLRQHQQHLSTSHPAWLLPSCSKASFLPHPLPPLLLGTPQCSLLSRCHLPMPLPRSPRHRIQPKDDGKSTSRLS